jgi:hypothetical protein
MIGCISMKQYILCLGRSERAQGDSTWLDKVTGISQAGT